MVQGRHDVVADDAPTMPVESAREAVGAGRLLSWHAIEGLPSFLHRERKVQPRHVHGRQVDVVPVDRSGLGARRAQHRLEMGMDDPFLVCVSSQDAIIGLQGMN